MLDLLTIVAVTLATTPCDTATMECWIPGRMVLTTIKKVLSVESLRACEILAKIERMQGMSVKSAEYSPGL